MEPQKSTHLKWFRVNLCAVALCKETQKPLLLLENVLDHSLTWCQDFWNRGTPEKKDLRTSVSGPEMPAVTLNPLASEAEGCFGSLQVEVRRLCAGQVCGYVSGVVASMGVGASWLPPSSESHCIVRLKYQNLVAVRQTELHLGHLKAKCSAQNLLDQYLTFN